MKKRVTTASGTVYQVDMETKAVVRNGEYLGQLEGSGHMTPMGPTLNEPDRVVEGLHLITHVEGKNPPDFVSTIIVQIEDIQE